MPLSIKMKTTISKCEIKKYLVRNKRQRDSTAFNVMKHIIIKFNIINHSKIYFPSRVA